MFAQIDAWMRRNARPLDMARYRVLTEDAPPDEALRCLRAYQNADGGFGHALEADAWNPHSSPIQTWCATEVLLSLGGDEAVSRDIARYLGSDGCFREGFWLAEIPSNNDYPHAPWWSYDENVLGEWGWNPTACLAGFLLCHAERGGIAYARAEDAAARAARDLLSDRVPAGDMNMFLCFRRLAQYLRASGRDDIASPDAMESAVTRLADATVCTDASRWGKDYVCKPSDVLDAPDYLLARFRDAAECEADWLLRNRWTVPWQWSDYPDAWAVSKNWWYGHIIVQNVRFLKLLDKLPS